MSAEIVSIHKKIGFDIMNSTKVELITHLRKEIDEKIEQADYHHKKFVQFERDILKLKEMLEVVTGEAP
jgi:hypothetical protein